MSYLHNFIQNNKIRILPVSCRVLIIELSYHDSVISQKVIYIPKPGRASIYWTGGF